jgi:hypothetical protein
MMLDLFSLLLYGSINIAMVLWYLRGRGRFYQFPFWAGMIALGFFFPQAVGGLFNSNIFPEVSYAKGMLFASLCTLGLWFGFSTAIKKEIRLSSWLNCSFDTKRLYYVGVFFCLFGFFFQWKLWSLPEEVLASSLWSGATVKYLFFASVFKFGLVVLLILYLSQKKVLNVKILIFLVPCFFLFFGAIVLRGRRAEMMNLFSYCIVSLWFIKKIAVPRIVLVWSVVLGLLFINGIGIYRGIMSQKEVSFSDRMQQAIDADYLQSSKSLVEEPGPEFVNYITYRDIYESECAFDFGLKHWNLLVFNFVPAQIVGRSVKNSFLLPIANIFKIAEEKRGYLPTTGSTLTGYCDSFGSFWWFGFIKYMLIGWVMARLYQSAICGYFFGQFLYVFSLNAAMHAITHTTHKFLFTTWVYFFLMGFPLLFWARKKH